ncbi:MAG: hypothetical protein C4584_01280 [Armatimonadetes bacterium]|nr:MAG: hypothetical protein C4584_01280 [Armatimonadota bacterium]
MAYLQMKKTSTSKRLEMIKTQLYGKESNILMSKPETAKVSFSTPVTSTHRLVSSDYLQGDIIRIGILATLAIGIQLVIFIGLKYGFLRF